MVQQWRKKAAPHALKNARGKTHARAGRRISHMRARKKGEKANFI